VAFVIPSDCESPVSDTDDNASAVGAGVDGGKVVTGGTVVGGTVVGGTVVGGTVVGGTVVGGTVVGGTVVATDCVGVVAGDDIAGVVTAMAGEAVIDGALGATYPHPDNVMFREIFTFAISTLPTRTRS
jgi:hypothetical protein